MGRLDKNHRVRNTFWAATSDWGTVKSCLQLRLKTKPNQNKMLKLKNFKDKNWHIERLTGLPFSGF